MISKPIFIIYFLLIFLNFNNIFSFENKILIKIDNDIITTIDLYNESNYLLALNQDLKNLDKNSIFEITKNSLIKDTIKSKELRKNFKNLKVEEKILNQIIVSIYKNKNFDNYNSFIDYLNKFDVSIEYIKNKISIELLWNNLIAEKFNKNVVIDKEKIKNDLQKNLNKNSKDYLLSEIIFDVTNSKNYEKKVETIENDINQKGFLNAVLIHSISNSASNSNGDIGWVNENSLNVRIKKEVDDLKIGDHTKPIKIPGGFLILKINDIRMVENQMIDLDKKVNEVINLERNNQLNNYSNIHFNKVKKEIKINEN